MSHFRGPAFITGNPATGDNGPEIQVLTQLLSGLIESSAQTHVPVVRVYKQVDGIEHIAIRIMDGKVGIRRDFLDAVSSPNLE